MLPQCPQGDLLPLGEGWPCGGIRALKAPQGVMLQTYTGTAALGIYFVKAECSIRP